MNIEELKRHFTHEVSHWGIFRDHTESQRKVEIAKGVLALLARLEAAQRLRDAVLHHFGTEGVKQWKNIADAIAAFDKDTQND